MELEECLKQYVKLIRGANKNSDRKFYSVEEFVLKKGQPFRITKCIEGEPKQCFCNSYSYAIKSNDYVYVEGYILYNSMLIYHAWVMDKNNDGIEVTLEKPAKEYFGVKFNLDYLMYIASLRKYYGVLDCPDIRFPLLKGTHKYLGNGKVQYDK